MFKIERLNKKFVDYMQSRLAKSCDRFAFCGGRRSGKTFFISQFLTLRAYRGEIINVASITKEQGRLGAFTDFKDIITDCPTLNYAFEILTSPLEIRNKFNSGRIYFNSYQRSETAKGIACDWLFMNEANYFTEQHVVDLRANVRKGWVIDYNPTCLFWVQNYFKDSDICRSDWRGNPFLTDVQKSYFADLLRNATKPNATAYDIWQYKVNYLGEYSELAGCIFTTENVRVEKLQNITNLSHFIIFIDPSDLRGSDFFAATLCATDFKNMYLIDTWSECEGSEDDVISFINKWRGSYNVEKVFLETNGIIGLNWYEKLRKVGIPITGWYSRGDKFERICANYQDIAARVICNDSPAVKIFLQQVYAFDKKCKHDDNIDALNSSLNYYKLSKLLQN